MRILYLHPRAWTGEYPMLAALQKLGHEIVVLEELKLGEDRPAGLSDHFLQPGDGMKTLWYNTRHGLAKLLTWPVDRFFKRAFDGRNLAHRMWLIRKACKQFQPDVILASEGFAYGIPATMLRLLSLIDVPVMVNYIGGDILDCLEADVGKRRTPLTSYLIKKGVAGADVLRPFSPLLGEALLAEGADPEKIHLIPGHMPANANHLRDIAGRRAELGRQLRQRYGIDAAAPLIVSLSANLKGKGLHFLAQAWPRVIQAIPTARWLLCGPDSPWLKEQVWPVLEKSGVAASVVTSGRLDGEAVFEHLACGDLCVMPTLADGGPMSNIEAIGVATPVLTTDQAGNAKWLQEAGCGDYVPASDPGALATRLIAMLSNPDRLRQMGIAGPDLAAGFTVEAVARRVSDLLVKCALR